ncbi:MAG: cytochrome c oxidase subunit II [Gammaproteobacteria bacterium]|nr:cytochrome c oxidase subunit II [Gammaproteobacteria bacterium]
MGFTKLKAALTGLAAILASTVSTKALADYTLNMTKGASELSGEIYDLHMLIFWVCVGIAVVVFGVMIYSIIYHRRSRNPEPAKFHHNTTVEVVWTVIPFVILILMAWPAAKTLLKMEDFRQSEVTIKVTGMQWKWQYDYIDDGFGFYSSLDADSNRIRQLGSGEDPFTKENYLLDVDNRMVVPVGQKVRLLLTSADVIHAWWVPDFARKRDAIPGFINEIWFNVQEPGVYRGQCAELCGYDHGFMPIVVEALPQDEYQQWIADQQKKYGVDTASLGMMDAAAAEAPAEESAEQAAPAEEAAAESAPTEWSMDVAMSQGEQVYSANCASCHMANGEGMDAAGFPALKGSAIATGDIAAHIDMVLNGSQQNAAMAAFGNMLSDEEIAAVITYERNAWGNDTGDLVSPSDIKAAR